MRLIVCLVVGLCCASVALGAWNPGSNWQDSYAVNGQCYCNSSNFDHGLNTKTARTPIGELNVVRICSDIESALGNGPQNGRVPYNDIQCGNGPVNNAADETGCPGRVDRGSDGCDQIGPKWNLEAVYGQWTSPCSATQTLTANRWYMLSLPCDVGIDTPGKVSDVFADDLGASGINSTWFLYRLTSAGAYQRMGLNDDLTAGEGYWFITTQDNVSLDVVGEYSIPVDFPLRSDNTNGAWTLIGSPYRFNVDWSDLQVVNINNGQVISLANASPGGDACTVMPFPSNCAVANTGFKWVGENGYETLNLFAGSLGAFEAAWMFTIQSGMKARLPMPAQARATR